MQSASRGGAMKSPTSDVPEERDQALLRERRQSDAGVQEERRLLDSTLLALHRDSTGAETGPEDRRILEALKDRIRAQRENIDRRRADRREATDAAVQVERSSRKDAIEAWEEGRREASLKLSLMLRELETIAVAANALRIDTRKHAAGNAFELAGEVELATQRVLNLMEHLLGPRN